jgi:hypothetical protein
MFKPSDGLEPSTPLLTIEQRGGTRGQGRQAAGTKAAQEERVGGRPVAGGGRACPQWCSLSVSLALCRCATAIPACQPGARPPRVTGSNRRRPRYWRGAMRLSKSSSTSRLCRVRRGPRPASAPAARGRAAAGQVLAPRSGGAGSRRPLRCPGMIPSRQQRIS